MSEEEGKANLISATNGLSLLRLSASGGQDDGSARRTEAEEDVPGHVCNWASCKRRHGDLRVLNHDLL